MTWLNPLAWIGLLAVAGPVIVHLLARRQIHKVRFPTLRFLDISRLTPARRRRLTDTGLLAVRIGVVAAAATALAQPVFLTPARDRTAADRLVRAVILDTSASMLGPAADGTVPLDAARLQAGSLAAEADASTLLEDERPARAIDGAAAWLATQSGRRELVIVSDFQNGAVSATDLRHVPESLGLRFVAVTTSSPGAGDMTFRLGDSEVTARLALTAETTDVTWQTRQLTAGAGDVRLLAGEGDAQTAGQVLRAARRLGPGGGRGGGPVAVVFPSYADHAALLQEARPVDEPWMFDLVDTIRRDAAVRNAARLATVADTPRPSPLLPVVLDTGGRALVWAGSGEIDGSQHILIFLRGGPASRMTAAVLAGIPTLGADGAAMVAELVQERLPVETLRAWERPAGPATIGTGPSDESDGRWLWLVALVLLGVEARVRRGTPDGPSTLPEVVRADAA